MQICAFSCALLHNQYPALISQFFESSIYGLAAFFVVKKQARQTVHDISKRRVRSAILFFFIRLIKISTLAFS